MIDSSMFFNFWERRAIKLNSLPSLKVIRPKRMKISLHKVTKFYRSLYQGGEHDLVPHHKVKSVKFHDFAELYLR